METQGPEFVQIESTGDEVPTTDVYEGNDTIVYYDSDEEQHVVIEE